MDEVWDVVVGTKSSVDDLLPKSDELLTQTQRQERAINDIHADLKQVNVLSLASKEIIFFLEYLRSDCLQKHS